MKRVYRAWIIGLMMTAGLWTAYGFYDPGPQRWLNRDPVYAVGSSYSEKHTQRLFSTEFNLFTFGGNSPTRYLDPDGRSLIDTHRLSELGRRVGLGGKCCNYSIHTEYWLDNGEWKELPPGKCTGFSDDCDGMTCGFNRFYEVKPLRPMQCDCGGNASYMLPPGTWSPPPPPPRPTDPARRSGGSWPPNDWPYSY